MNHNQKLVIKLTALLLLICLLFPPFQINDNFGRQVFTKGAGHSFIFDPPSNFKHGQGRIDSTVLITYLLGICLLGGIGFFFAKHTDRPFSFRKKKRDIE
jgi:hypothetical protein